MASETMDGWRLAGWLAGETMDRCRRPAGTELDRRSLQP
jgi:hypothetical protein